MIIREMQVSMDARVELTIRASGGKEKPHLVIKATAYPYLTVPMEHRHSVSLSASIQGSSVEMGVACIFRLLLALDYEVSKAWATTVAT